MRLNPTTNCPISPCCVIARGCGICAESASAARASAVATSGANWRLKTSQISVPAIRVNKSEAIRMC